VKFGSSLGCSGPALVEFAVLRNKGQMKSIKALNCRKASFQLFKELVNITPWETALMNRGSRTQSADL